MAGLLTVQTLDKCKITRAMARQDRGHLKLLIVPCLQPARNDCQSMLVTRSNLRRSKRELAPPCLLSESVAAIHTDGIPEEKHSNCDLIVLNQS
eukprot:g5542.t1